MGELISGSMAIGGTFGRRRTFTLYDCLKKPFFGRFMKPWRWPVGVAHDQYTPVVINSRSGAALQALVRSAGADARGAVVLAHPMGLTAKGFWLKYGHADAFAERGWHVVVFDFNGFGESPSGNLDYPGDLIAVGTYSRRRFTDCPIVVVGASFGAMHALEAVSEAGQPFDAAVAEAAAPTLSDFWRHYRFTYIVLQVLRVLYPALERSLNPVYQLARAEKLPPLLLVHSKSDKWAPPKCGDRIEAAASKHARVQRWTVEQAEHTHALRDARAGYLSEVFAFLNSIDKRQLQR